MKKLLLISFLAVLVVAGCSQKTSLPEDDQSKTQEKATMTQAQLFEKKKECLDYKDKIEKERQKDTLSLKSFYSPIKNTCIVEIYGDIDFGTYSVYGRQLTDMFTSEILFDCETRHGSSGDNVEWQVCNLKLNQMIKDLKGE